MEFKLKENRDPIHWHKVYLATDGSNREIPFWIGRSLDVLTGEVVNITNGEEVNITWWFKSYGFHLKEAIRNFHGV